MAFSTLIDAATLRGLAGKPDTVVIDCRFDLNDPEAGRRAYLAGHIPGARYADLNRDLSAPLSASSGRHPLPALPVFAAALERLGIGNATQVIAYDDAGGAYAARAWWLLRWLGHTSVAVLDGGMKAWSAAGGTLESGPETPLGAAPAGGRIVPQVNAAAVIDTAEIAAFLSDGANLLVDARAAERYAGSVEPIDTVAGHISGAVNHPFSSNLGPDGLFLAAPELRRRWEARLAGRQAARVAAMCGSGVTACHNLLSMEIAGLRGARLYAGSWSEWIKDPNRPIARGS
ncbi:MAG TPA: sulfurtransferase [Steroidobacteraceae bacterium]|nr:sulfurtransferase [Steroidobacteraceae bacterium]